MKYLGIVIALVIAFISIAITEVTEAGPQGLRLAYAFGGVSLLLATCVQIMSQFESRHEELEAAVRRAVPCDMERYSVAEADRAIIDTLETSDSRSGLRIVRNTTMISGPMGEARRETHWLPEVTQAFKQCAKII